MTLLHVEVSQVGIKAAQLSLVHPSGTGLRTIPKHRDGPAVDSSSSSFVPWPDSKSKVSSSAPSYKSYGKTSRESTSHVKTLPTERRAPDGGLDDASSESPKKSYLQQYQEHVQKNGSRNLNVPASRPTSTSKDSTQRSSSLNRNIVPSTNNNTMKASSSEFHRVFIQVTEPLPKPVEMNEALMGKLSAAKTAENVSDKARGLLNNKQSSIIQKFKSDSEPSIANSRSLPSSEDSSPSKEQGRVKLLSSKLEAKSSDSSHPHPMNKRNSVEVMGIQQDEVKMARTSLSHPSTTTVDVAKRAIQSNAVVAPTNVVSVSENIATRKESPFAIQRIVHSQPAKSIEKAADKSEDKHKDINSSSSIRFSSKERAHVQETIQEKKNINEIVHEPNMGRTPRSTHPVLSSRDVRKHESTEIHPTKVSIKPLSSLQKKEGSALSTTSSHPSTHTTTTTTVSNTTTTTDDSGSSSSLQRARPSSQNLEDEARPSVSKVKSLLWDDHKHLKWQKKSDTSRGSQRTNDDGPADNNTKKIVAMPPSNAGLTVMSARMGRAIAALPSNSTPTEAESSSSSHLPSSIRKDAEPLPSGEKVPLTEKVSEKIPPVEKAVEQKPLAEKLSVCHTPSSPRPNGSTTPSSPFKWNLTTMDPTVMLTRFGRATTRSSKVSSRSHSLVLSSPNHPTHEIKTEPRESGRDSSLILTNSRPNELKSSSISSKASSSSTDVVPTVTRTPLPTTTFESESPNTSQLHLATIEKETKESGCESSASSPNKRSNASTELVRITSNGNKTWNGWEKNKSTLHISTYDIHMSMKSDKEELDSISDEDLHSDSTLSSITNPTYLGYEIVGDGGGPNGGLENNFIVHGRSIASRIKAKEAQDENWFDPKPTEGPPTDLFAEPMQNSNKNFLHSPEHRAKLPVPEAVISPIEFTDPMQQSNKGYLYSPERRVKLPVLEAGKGGPMLPSLEKIDCTESLKRIHSSPKKSPLKSYILTSPTEDTGKSGTSNLTMIQESRLDLSSTLLATVEDSPAKSKKSIPQGSSIVHPTDDVPPQVSKVESTIEPATKPEHKRTGSFPMLMTVFSYGGESSSSSYVSLKKEKKRTGSLPPSKREWKYPEKRIDVKASSSNETNPYLRRKYKALSKVQ